MPNVICKRKKTKILRRVAAEERKKNNRKHMYTFYL